MSYVRRDLLERHAWRTGLHSDPAVLEQAALVVCGAMPGEAPDLLATLGLIHPDGAPKVGVRIKGPASGRFAPVPGAHVKRGRAK